MIVVPPEPGSPRAEFLRRELVRIRNRRGLSMRDRFFVTDVIAMLESGFRLSDKQMRWASSLCETHKSKKDRQKDRRIQDAIDALKANATTS